MASNSFGEIFRITTFGESHGSHIGVVIDGCPANIELTVEEINRALSFRAPGKSPYTSPRNEEDLAEIISGVFEGKTTGAPITIMIKNKDPNPSAYDELKNLLRPSHANYSYLKKYGIYDHRGGGRASARETAARVAAGSVAKKVLEPYGIQCLAFVEQIGLIKAKLETSDFETLREKTVQSPIFCPDLDVSVEMEQKLTALKQEGDSIGGVIRGIAHVPPGLGDPIYRKVEALLAFAMLSIPASKGFEIGEGFHAASMRGSEHNDFFDAEDSRPFLKTNRSGGILGGITTGEPLLFKVAFKPTSSIKKSQDTVTLDGERKTFQLSKSARHDPCVAIRAVPVVEAMTALVLVDALLMDQTSKRPQFT